MSRHACLIFYTIYAIALIYSRPLCSSADEIRGNGNVTTEEFHLSSNVEIKEIDLQAAFTVHVSQGLVQPILIVAESNIIPVINFTEQTSGIYNTLVISILQTGDKNNTTTLISPTKPVDIYITIPKIKVLINHASGTIVTETPIINKAESLIASLNFDGGQIKFGKVEVNDLFLVVAADGSMELNGGGESQSASIHVYGSGHVTTKGPEPLIIARRLSVYGDDITGDGSISLNITGSDSLKFVKLTTKEGSVSIFGGKTEMVETSCYTGVINAETLEAENASVMVRSSGSIHIFAERLTYLWWPGKVNGIGNLTNHFIIRPFLNRISTVSGIDATTIPVPIVSGQPKDIHAGSSSNSRGLFTVQNSLFLCAVSYAIMALFTIWKNE